MLEPIAPALQHLLLSQKTKFVCYDPPEPEVRGRETRGRPPKGDKPMTQRERSERKQARKSEMRARCIAVLDMETDPFDAATKAIIRPFAACLYSDQFEPVMIWETYFDVFVTKVIATIEALPEPYTIYAHNGGKFDYMFLIHKIRGQVSFKGRGIMSARLGKHELRDSYHIIPERLANIQKDKFDYEKMSRNQRQKYRQEIEIYLLHDCEYLFNIVRSFIDEFGMKLSIGQAALCELSKHYKVKKFSENWDEYIRRFYYGGRVECIRGIGDFHGAYRLYDVNSMYPDVMSRYSHPIGDFHDYTLRLGIPSNDTVFVDVTCDNNGGLVGRDENKETTATMRHGRFYTTIWEYETSLRYGLISRVRVNYCVDCRERSDFSDFVRPLYERRQAVKVELASLRQNGIYSGSYYYDLLKDDIFLKLLLNNAYGKFGQNPRKFKEHYLTDPGEFPPDEWFQSLAYQSIKDAKSKKVSTWLDLLEKTATPETAIHLLPHFEGERYWIWQKPCPRFNYNNVGVAASITGAARAVLLEALQHAREPIYCDTDSIICKDLQGVPLHKTDLGAWDLEDEYTRVIIDGKKLYSVWHAEPKGERLYTVKSKGTADLTWQNMEDMLNGQVVRSINRAPTIDRYGDQYYIERDIRATGRRATDALDAA
jgi:hypothetical protein